MQLRLLTVLGLVAAATAVAVPRAVDPMAVASKVPRSGPTRVRDDGDITSGLPENIQNLVDDGEVTCEAGATGDVTCTDQDGVAFQFTDTGGAGLDASK
ncbi:hypothetical protein GGR56DRAFT_689552 [Xylariaceae sp. FL0804]|nr:hypothetical protein GGR56DRAFT_689552 [Xylariaceae sp. FL0804]